MELIDNSFICRYVGLNNFNQKKKEKKGQTYTSVYGSIKVDPEH